MTKRPARSPASHGLVAVFADAKPLLEAARAAYAEGYRRLDAYSPLPVEGLAEAIGFGSNRVPLIALIGGIVGATGAYALQVWSAVFDYPIVSGGRPLHSWPPFIIPTFEMAVLGAACGAFFGMLILNGLPRLIHPVFDIPGIEAAARDRFLLCIRADDAAFDDGATRRFLERHEPLRIVEVADGSELAERTR